LPTAQAATGVDDFPTRAAEDALHIRGRGFQNQTAPQGTRQPRGCGKSRNERPAASTWRSGKTVGAATVITNVIATVHRRCDPSVTFLHHRSQKIAWITAAVQSRLRHARRIEAALESESGFLWRVIKSADDEIFAGMTTGAPLQLFILNFQALDNFRPRNVGTRDR